MDAELQQLKDIHLPTAITLWPIAPGWILLFLLVLSLISYFIYVWYQHHQQKRTIKFALVKLKKLLLLVDHNPENINIAGEISTLLRRTALYYFHREEIAGLSGKDWLDFLNRSGNTNAFTEAGLILINAPYRKNNTDDLLPLFEISQTWLVTLSKKKMES